MEQWVCCYLRNYTKPIKKSLQSNKADGFQDENCLHTQGRNSPLSEAHKRRRVRGPEVAN